MTTFRQRVEAFAAELTQDEDFASATSSNAQVAQVLRDLLAEPEQHQLNRAALSMADLAFMDAEGSNADRVKAAIIGYLFALNSRQRFGDGYIYPSLNDMREHFEMLKAQAQADALRHIRGD